MITTAQMAIAMSMTVKMPIKLIIATMVLANAIATIPVFHIPAVLFFEAAQLMEMHVHEPG